LHVPPSIPRNSDVFLSTQYIYVSRVILAINKYFFPKNSDRLTFSMEAQWHTN